jgi:hypothetical protein
MGTVLVSILIALAIYALGIGAIWLAAYNEFWWCFVPANTFAFVTWGTSDSTNVAKLTGGELDKIIHGIPGKYLDTTTKPDPFDWEFVDETEDKKEERSLLHSLFGIHWIGYGRSLRVNQIHEIRFKKVRRKIRDTEGKEVEKDFYDTEGKDYPAKFVYYSREQSVEVTGSETLGTYEIDSRFNLLYAMKQPIRAVFKMADPNGLLITMVMQATNQAIGMQEPDYFLQGKEDHKQDLIRAVWSIRPEVEKQIGIDITTVNLFSISVDAETRKLLELQATTKRENKAAIATAMKDRRLAILAGEGKAKAQMAVNVADADRVAKVLEPLGKIPNAAGIRFAEAIEKNEKLTTLVVGGNTAQLIGATK